MKRMVSMTLSRANMRKGIESLIPVTFVAINTKNIQKLLCFLFAHILVPFYKLLRLRVLYLAAHITKSVSHKYMGFQNFNRNEILCKVQQTFVVEFSQAEPEISGQVDGIL